MNEAQTNDARLVAETLAGDQDAFRRIVERYQTLICALAYSATGSVSLSEDLAQETFVAAWKDLARLREPAKLRSWLCSIVRFRISQQFRRQGREPSHAAEPLDAAESAPAPQPQPSAQAINREETALLWRSLENIPELYREPLVLFYREHQSVEAVAANLDLSEDAVKQRLTRGRKMLQEQVLAFVEGALGRTNPGQAFTAAVLAALPVMVGSSAKAALAATAAVQGGALVKGAAVGSVFGALLGPALGLLGGYWGLRTSLKSACTPRERAFIIRFAVVIGGAAVIFVAALLFFVFQGRSLSDTHPALFIVAGVGLTAVYGAFVFASSWRFGRAFMALRREEKKQHPDAFRPEPLPLAWDYRSRAKLFGIPLVHCRAGKLPGEKLRPAVGWIAFGEIAYGILFANGGVAVGGISVGGVSIGILSFGGFGLGLLALGGVALGGLAVGGAALGFIASGGIGVAWHAALGGVAAAHDLALGGTALAHHANDDAARDFFIRHSWLNFTQGTPRIVFSLVCFVPVILQAFAWHWWREKMQRQARAV